MSSRLERQPPLPPLSGGYKKAMRPSPCCGGFCFFLPPDKGGRGGLVFRAREGLFDRLRTGPSIRGFAATQGEAERSLFQQTPQGGVNFKNVRSTKIAPTGLFNGPCQGGRSDVPPTRFLEQALISPDLTPRTGVNRAFPRIFGRFFLPPLR